VIAFVVRNEDGTMRGVAGLAEDVTEPGARRGAPHARDTEVILGAQPDLFFRLAGSTVLEHRPATACRPRSAVPSSARDGRT
jgi:hypothetical protein